MPLTFNDHSARDKFDRCKREASFMEKEVTTDGFVRFAENAWHLRDWILSDVCVPQAAKNEVIPWKSAKPIPELSVCQDVANECKHMRITRYAPPTADASSRQGYGVGRFGRGGFGIGEQQITITMTDGTTYDGLGVVRAVIKLWEDFFARHGL